ncbi:MAG: exodeoxyribonuclease VII large subunit [Gemmataceae bacterium]
MLPAENVKILTIGEVTRALKCLVEDAFPSLWVTGEITSYKKHSSGHHYFTLKDAEAQLKAVIWRGTASRLRFNLGDGMEIIGRGRLDIYSPHGEYKFILEEVHPKGLGAQEIALRQLKEKLLALGYFDPIRKKVLPRLPSRLAVVTSPTGAAIRDIIKILSRRWPLVEIWICPVKVQGDGAEQEIAAAIRQLNAIHDGGKDFIDLVIVGRGGGGQEDLWAFNGPSVAQAIFASGIPIISAVGHEIDLTVADLVSDRRAATPSEAAEIAVPDRQDILQGVRGTQDRLGELLIRRLERSRGLLQELAERRPFRYPLERILDFDQQLDGWYERLERAMTQRLTQAKQKFLSRAAQLESLSPLNVLGRGYSLTRVESDQTVVRRPEQVRQGDRIVTFLRQGSIVSRVEKSGEDNT